MYLRIARFLAVIAVLHFGWLPVGPSIVRADDTVERKVKNRVSPVYPELAKRMSITGTVKIEVVVAPNGTVKSTRVIGGHPVLVDCALEAVRKWRYEAASEESTQVVEFKFLPVADH